MFLFYLFLLSISKYLTKTEIDMYDIYYVVGRISLHMNIFTQFYRRDSRIKQRNFHTQMY